MGEQDGSNTLVYDAESRLLSATNGSASGSYTYDGNNLRVKKVAGSTTTVYIFSGSKVIAEYDNGAAVSSPSREYIYSGGQLLAKIDSSGTKYYHQDQLSNRVVTDSSGNKVAEMGHYPFGESWYNATNDKLLVTSYERDSESGNDYAMARSYVSRLGRFSSPDPLAGSISNPQSLNLSPYVLNDPAELIDPWGLCGGGPGSVSSTIIAGDGSRGSTSPEAIFTSPDCPLDGQGSANAYLIYRPGVRGGGGNSSGAANNGLKQKICNAIPSGRTTGASGGVGGVGSPGGGGELVVNYDTGQVSAFAFGGFQVGWNGGVSGSVYTGFVWGLNGSNSNYSGGFTGVNGGAGLGGFAESSSGGLTGGTSGLVSNGKVNAAGISVGGGLLGGFSGGATATNYSNPAQLGKFWGFGLNPVDWLLYAARQVCR